MYVHLCGVWTDHRFEALLLTVLFHVASQTFKRHIKQRVKGRKSSTLKDTSRIR